MTLSNRPNYDPVSQRKQAVRKHANRAGIAAGVGVVSLAVGLTIFQTTLLSVFIPIIAAIVVVYSGVQINKIVNHKDQW